MSQHFELTARSGKIAPVEFSTFHQRSLPASPHFKGTMIQFPQPSIIYLLSHQLNIPN